MSDLETRRDALAALALPDGGWGYAPGQAAHLEPTCLALLALAPQRDRYAAVIERAFKAIRQQAGPDGSYRLSSGREEAVWPTALVLFVEATLGAPANEIQKAASRLLAIQGRTLDPNEAAAIQDINVTIVGWPWAEGNFSWVEPTSWACIALRRAGFEHHARVVEGQRLLVDRTFATGGINYGNRMVFNKSTEPFLGPSALMLMALQGQGFQDPVRNSVNYVGTQAASSTDLEHLAWCRLALDCYTDLPRVADEMPALDARIREAEQQRTGETWVQTAIVRQALACLALAASEGNPFRLTESQGAMPTVLPMAKRRGKSWGDRFKSAFQGVVVNAITNLRPVPAKADIHISRAADYNADLVGILQRQFEAYREKVPLRNKRVVLKPNLVEYRRDRVINTHPNFVAAVIELCKKEGAAEVIVAEGPGHWRNVEYLVSASGLGDVLRHYKVPFVDLNHDDPVKKPNLGRATGLEHLYLSKTIDTAEVLISLPKLKTHHWAGATLSLKNLFGTLPGICYGWPKNELHWRGIHNSIVDIALTRMPDLAIVDGIIGMEGDGPLNGTPKEVGALVMGTDLMAVDATCCRLMQLDPMKVGYLELGALKKLGALAEAEIQQLGETIASLAQPFETIADFQHLYFGRSA